MLRKIEINSIKLKLYNTFKQKHYPYETCRCNFGHLSYIQWSLMNQILKAGVRLI